MRRPLLFETSGTVEDGCLGAHVEDLADDLDSAVPQLADGRSATARLAPGQDDLKSAAAELAAHLETDATVRACHEGGHHRHVATP